MSESHERKGDHPTKEKYDEYYYSMLNSDIEKTFTHEQREEVKAVFKRIARVPSKKIIDFRTSFWLIKWLYIVVFIGVDRRRKQRGNYEDKASIIRLALKMLVYLVLFVLLLVLIFLALYLLKSALGIDLFPDKHLTDFI